MALKDLTREEAIALLGRIARGLETTESARDFCMWLENTFQEDAGISVGLNGAYESGAIPMDEFKEHMFQASLPDSDPRKRD